MINNCERKFKLSKRKLFSCSFFRSTVSHENRSNGMTTWSHENHGDKFSRRIQNSLTVTAIRFMRLCELYNEISSFNRSPTRVMQAWKFGKSIIESERKYRFFSPPFISFFSLSAKIGLITNEKERRGEVQQRSREPMSWTGVQNNQVILSYELVILTFIFQLFFSHRHTMNGSGIDSSSICTLVWKC